MVAATAAASESVANQNQRKIRQNTLRVGRRPATGGRASPSPGASVSKRGCGWCAYRYPTPRIALMRSDPSPVGPSLRRNALIRLSMPRSSIENSRSNTVRKRSSREITCPAEVSNARSRSNSAEVSSTGSLSRRTARRPTSSVRSSTARKSPGWRCPAGARPAQNRPHPGDEFARVKRFGQVIVRADLQPPARDPPWPVGQ